MYSRILAEFQGDRGGLKMVPASNRLSLIKLDRRSRSRDLTSSCIGLLKQIG